MSTLTEDSLNFKLLNLNLTNDYYKTTCALSLILLSSIIFYCIHLFMELIFGKYTEELALKSCEKYFKNDNFNDTKLKTKRFNDTLWMFKNLQISFIHSVLSSIFVCYVYFTNVDLFNDLLVYTSNSLYLLIAFSLGYFAYDFMDMYLNNKLGELWIVVVHHILVYASFGYNIINLNALGYTFVALFAEFNSIFLHSRKLLKYSGYKKSSFAFKLNSFFNCLTFILFRFVVLVYILTHFYWYNHRLGKTHWYITLISLCAMFAMNVGIFLTIVIKDFAAKKLNKSKILTNGITTNGSSSENFFAQDKSE